MRILITVLFLTLFSGITNADYDTTVGHAGITTLGLYVNGATFFNGAAACSGSITVGGKVVFADSLALGCGFQENAIYYDGINDVFVGCANQTPITFTLKTDWDTCSDFAANLTDETGSCGKVVLSENPTIGHLALSGPNSTPAATPTATGATPTATGVTPTPTPTSTPEHNGAGDLGLDGNIKLVGNVARSISLGPCTMSPCNGRSLSISSGDGVKAGTGGSLDFTSGAGANFQQGGAISHTVGSGGGHITETTRRGLSNVGGKYYIYGDIINGIAAGGTRPTFSAGCGSTASDSLATNNQGRIATTGTGQTATCTVTFGNGGFTNITPCFAQNEAAGTAGAIVQATPTTTTIALKNILVATGVGTNFLATDVIDYWCPGRE